MHRGLLAPFAELKQRPVLVIGGGEIAERKIKFLLRAQAQVQVVAETLSPALADLAARPGTQLAGDGIQRLAGG